MSDFHVLIAEDNSSWLEEIDQALRPLSARVELASSYDQAYENIKRYSFDLAIIDLSLVPENPAHLGGMDLIRELRASPNNQHCGIIVISGKVSALITDRLKSDYGVFKVIDKGGASDPKEVGGFRPAIDQKFADTAREAILDGYLTRAAFRSANRFRLTIIFDEGHILSSGLTGPGRRTIHIGKYQTRLGVKDLAAHADLLNSIIINIGAEVWRPEAKLIGKGIYEAVTSHRHVLINLNAAQSLAKTPEDVWLEFVGPAVGLGVPFELMRPDEDEPIVLQHVITRQVSSISTKPEPFYHFIRDLLKTQEPLRILITGANSDDQIPMAEIEAGLLEESFRERLALLGIKFEITRLSGGDATYKSVREILQHNNYHIFHYSGHGRHDDDNPERSGLVLRDGNSLRVLAATELNSLIRDKSLRLVYLSSCTSARTADRAGRGDFHGVFEALAKANVPVVIGFRWSVSDTAAKEFADVFYRELWRTFSPGEAVLRARQNAERGVLGRDDDTWLSPVMLMQSA
jgi:CheY-like chemotaxis protein